MRVGGGGGGGDTVMICGLGRILPLKSGPHVQLLLKGIPLFHYISLCEILFW